MRNLVLIMQLKAMNKVNSVKESLKNKSGEGFVDTAVKILMSVVIGALVLGGLYLLFKDTVLPTLTQRIKDMFNFKG
ncbi:hypothetical protein AGR56_05990 [Clostridium sp. DMHC 10]|uniref:DUF6133 family protein n=1 Tax=Clostridium sp. DMHC 10 TaxID=747377 RepID=UPI00069F70D5|nr:DUF6133 family protein [Clostridium sp. DMHC 10]KOF56362.1 hypothetical protein AGR56_05990 [Clostridium sp. DMHC 10]